GTNPPQLKRWDVETGRETWRAPARKNPAAMVFSPDARYLAEMTSDGETAIRDMTDGKVLHVRRPPEPLAARGIFSVGSTCALHPDGKRVALVTRVGELKIWVPPSVLQSRRGSPPLSGLYAPVAGTRDPDEAHRADAACVERHLAGSSRIQPRRKAFSGLHPRQCLQGVRPCRPSGSPDRPCGQSARRGDGDGLQPRWISLGHSPRRPGAPRLGHDGGRRLS